MATISSTFSMQSLRYNLRTRISLSNAKILFLYPTTIHKFASFFLVKTTTNFLYTIILNPDISLIFLSLFLQLHQLYQRGWQHKLVLSSILLSLGLISPFNCAIVSELVEL